MKFSLKGVVILFYSKPVLLVIDLFRLILLCVCVFFFWVLILEKRNTLLRENHVTLHNMQIYKYAYMSRSICIYMSRYI